jgi:hypothetical protein
MANFDGVFDSDYFSVFSNNRNVPSPIINFYLWQLIDEPQCKLLDVGAGTGQFSKAARTFWRASPTLLEPSRSASLELLSEFEKSQIVPKTFEEFVGEKPLQEFNAVLLSEVSHLIKSDESDFLLQLKSLLAESGKVLIRTSTRDQLLARSWYEFFPTAHEVDLLRHMDLQRLEVLAPSLGLRARLVSVDESRWVPSGEYLEWFSSKSYSTLRLIGEDEFEIGLRRLQSELKNRNRAWHHYEMSALILELV